MSEALTMVSMARMGEAGGEAGIGLASLNTFSGLWSTSTAQGHYGRWIRAGSVRL